MINKICYFFIVFILILNNYIARIFSDIITSNTLFYIKLFNILIIFILTIVSLLNEKISIIKYKKIVLLFIFFSVLLKKYYLSFYIVIISKNIYKKIRLKYVLFIFCFFYISVIVLNYLNLLEFKNTDFGVRYFVHRQALGFGHPNTAMSLLLPIFSILYYKYYTKYPKVIIILILILGKIIFDLTYSRTTFLLLILFVILMLVKDKYLKKIKYLFLFEGVFIVFLTFYLPFYYRTSLLNKLFSGRLRLFHYYLTNYKITFLGNKEIIKLYDNFPLDNSYLRTLFENGMIGFLLLIILTFIIMYILFKNKDYKAIRIFAIILIFGFMEGNALLYYFNVIYFIISDYIFKDKKIHRKGLKYAKRSYI